MELRFNAKNTIHIANASSREILVIAVSNKDWAPVDIGFSFVKSALVSAIIPGGAGASVATAQKVSALASTIKTVTGLYSVFSKLQKVYRTLDAIGRKHLETQNDHVRQLFAASSIRVPVGEHRAVHEKTISPFADIEPMIPASFVASARAGGEALGDLASALKDASVLPRIAINFWNALDPSVALATLSGVGDITVFVATSDFSRMCTFNSNSDHSWIVQDDEIVRSKYGHVSVADRSAGWHFFSNTIGSSLCADEYLEPGESLDIQTVNYDDSPNDRMDDLPDAVMDDLPNANMDDLPDSPADVDAAPGPGLLDQVTRTAVHKVTELGADALRAGSQLHAGVIGATRTLGSSPYKLIYQKDGDLVLYRVGGDSPTRVWGSGTAGRTAWRVCMQKDGNLAVYSAPERREWAIWDKVPGKDLYTGGHIALDRVSGKIAYFREGMPTPDFHVDEKEDCYRADV